MCVCVCTLLTSVLCSHSVLFVHLKVSPLTPPISSCMYVNVNVHVHVYTCIEYM